jgi:hypothetical protein
MARGDESMTPVQNALTVWARKGPVKRGNHIQVTPGEMTIIAIVAAASILLAVSTENNFFVPIFAAETVAAVYLALWIGSAP